MKPVVIDPSTIRDRAYARWQERGCPEGSAEQDWIEAERDLAEQATRDGLPPHSSLPQPPSMPPSAPPSERMQPPRPTLKRSPGVRAARLSNQVTSRSPISRTQIALAAAAAAYMKRSAVGSG